MSESRPITSVSEAGPGPALDYQCVAKGTLDPVYPGSYLRGAVTGVVKNGLLDVGRTIRRVKIFGHADTVVGKSRLEVETFCFPAIR